MIMPAVGEQAAASTSSVLQQISTGGQVDSMTMALIDAANDKEKIVASTILKSLCVLGKQQPKMVLSSCHVYIRKHAKLPVTHKIIILRVLEYVCGNMETLETIGHTLAHHIIQLASDELTMSKEVNPEWQNAASDVLVAIGKKFCVEVLEEMREKFQPGILPHYFVVQTLANLSTINVYGVVPFVSAILGTTLPMLGLCRHDNLKYVFAFALSKFSESILDYIANKENSPDPTITKSMYSNEIDAAFDVLFNVWLLSKESKLRLVIVEALGYMAYLMSNEKLAENLHKLLAGVMSLYKKHSQQQHYPVTQALYNILDAVVRQDAVVLDAHLEMLMTSLFPHVCILPDFTNQTLVKNHNEILRCFDIIVQANVEKAVSFLVRLLDNNVEKARLGTLTIIKHIINSSDAHLESKKAVILSGLKLILLENNNKVKKRFAQVVIAMAHHGYLELDGGQDMVEFIVKQCALSSDSVDKQISASTAANIDAVSNDALKAMCNDVLHLLSTTVDQVNQVLWPYLLETLTVEPWTEAMAIVCRCAAVLASKKRDEQAEDFYLDFECLTNVPKPFAIIARLVVLLGHPMAGNNRGLHILRLLLAMSPNLHTNLVALWDMAIPKLISHLQGAIEEPSSWSQKGWEDLILKLLSKTLHEVDSDDWTCQLGVNFSQQLNLYEQECYDKDKNILYKCLGVVMSKTLNKSFVSTHLDVIYNSVQHASQLQREGCAIGAGYCASAHFDMVLTKLETLLIKPENVKKSGGFLSFIKETVRTSDGGHMEKVKATLMLSYGFVALYAPPTLLISRMEATMMRQLTSHFKNIKDVTVKQNLIRSMDLVAKAVHVDHLKSSYILSNRSDIIANLQVFVEQENKRQLFTETRALAMNACASLVKLDPKLSEAELYSLIETVTNAVYALDVNFAHSKKGIKEESYDDLLEHDVLLESTFEALDDLLCEMLMKDVTPSGLIQVVKHLEVWMKSEVDVERQRSLSSAQQLLTLYLCKVQLGIGNDTEFSCFGYLLARLTPRCTDPNLLVRQLSTDCIHTILKIFAKYQDVSSESKEDEMVDAIPLIKSKVAKGDAQTLFAISTDLAKIISKKLPADELYVFLSNIIEALTDVHSHSSSAACVLLNSVFKLRGNELLNKVEILLEEIFENLGKMPSSQTRTGTLRCVRTLATHHLTPVLTWLLQQPLPNTMDTVDCWQTLALDESLADSMLQQLLQLLSTKVPYQEKMDAKKSKTCDKVAHALPLSALCAITEMCKVDEVDVMKHFRNFFPRLLLCIGSYLDVKPPKQEPTDDKHVSLDMNINPSRTAVNTFKQMLKAANCHDMLSNLEEENCFDLLEDDDTFIDSIALITQRLARHHADHMPDVVASLSSALASLYDMQRVVVVAFYAELINEKCCGDVNMSEILMNHLLGRLVDTIPRVRMLCIRGLGNISSMGSDQVHAYATTVLSAMMSGMDDKEDIDDDITLESMAGFSKILAEIDEKHVRNILINISLRIRPCFEKEKTAVRATAFTLFGNLARFGDGPSKDPFLEQIHSNFVSILLHLNDEDAEVVKSCKYALRKLGALMNSVSLDNMFQTHLLDNYSLYYREFINDLSKVLITEFREKVNFYVMGAITFFKSNWPHIRSNAASFVGFILGNMEMEHYQTIAREHVCGALIVLLKDPAKEVRMATAKAICRIPNF